MVVSSVRPIKEIGKWLNEHGGNWNDTHSFVVNLLWEDEVLREKYIREIIGTYVWTAIRFNATLKRLNISRRATSNPTEQDRKRRTTTILEWPLQGGLELGDARCSDLEQEISIYEGHARSNTVRALWLRKVLNRLPNRLTKVKTVLKLTEIEGFYKDSEEAYDGKNSLRAA